MTGDFDHIFAGIRIGSSKERDHRFIQLFLSVQVQQIGKPCLRMGQRIAQAQLFQLRAQLLMQLTQMADAGKYSVKVEKSFPLAKTGDALSYGRTGDREGKVIIDVHKDAKKT